MITLSTIILGTTMTVGDGLLSLGISMAANKIGDKLKEWLTPVEEDALYFAYENALDRWCKNTGGRDFMRYRLKDLKGLFLDYLKGDISSASTEIQELMGLWYEEICKSEDCRHYLESGRFKILLQEISATSLIAKSNGEKLDVLSSQLADVDEHVIGEIKSLKEEINKQFAAIKIVHPATTQRIIGVTTHTAVAGYFQRYCHSLDEDPGFNLYLANQTKRYTLLECIMEAESATDNNHYVLYGSAQAGKSTELLKLAFDLQQSNLYLPILIESKYYPNLAIGDLPEFERKDGKTVVLLIDALDEVSDYDNIRTQIEGYSKLHPTMIIVASCRSNYRTLAKMQGFKELVLEDMLWQDVVEYVNNNATKPKQLIAAIEESKLHPLLTTPFIVKNVVVLFNNKGRLPKDKNDLYENFITLAYETACEKLQHSITRSQQNIIDYHVRVAIVMQLTKRQNLTKEELLQIAENDETLVNDSLRVNLMEKDGDSYGFIHNAFREYFSARYLMQKASLSEVQAIVCYKDTTQIKPLWYNVILLWLTMKATQNSGVLADEIIKWLRVDGSNVLVHSDYLYIDQSIRTSIFIEIIESHKQRNQYIGSIQNDDYRILMHFGESDDTIAYLTDEINKTNEPCVHLSNLFALLPYITWSTLAYKQPLHDGLVVAIKAKLPMLDDDNNNCGVHTILYTDYFSKQASVYYPLLKDYTSISAMSALVYMISRSTSVESYLDYLLTVDEKLSQTGSHVAERQTLYKAYQQVVSTQSVMRVLAYITDERYVNHNHHDKDFLLTENVLLDKVESFVAAGEQDVIKGIESVFCERVKSIYPYIATDGQKELLKRYRKILIAANLISDEYNRVIEERLVDRSMSDKELKRRYQLLQDEFDEFCDYGSFKAKVYVAVERLKTQKDIAYACIDLSSYVHEFVHFALWHKEINPDLLAISIENQSYYESFRMCIINRILGECNQRISVSDEQRLLAASTARQFVDKFLTGDPNCCTNYIDTAIQLVIRGVLTIADDEIKNLFQYAFKYITIPSTELYESGRNLTLFEIMCQQLGDENFTLFLTEKMQSDNLAISELSYLLCADYILRNEVEDLYGLLIDRIMKDVNPSFVTLLIQKVITNPYFQEHLCQLYQCLKHKSNKTDILTALVDSEGYRAWALREMNILLPNLSISSSRSMLIAILCEHGETSVLDYLLEHGDDLHHTGYMNFRFSDSRAMEKLIALLQATRSNKSDIFNTRPYAIIYNIVQIASTDKSLLDQAVGSFKVLQNAKKDEGNMFAQAIDACNRRYMENSEHTPDVEEAIRSLTPKV